MRLISNDRLLRLCQAREIETELTMLRRATWQFGAEKCSRGEDKRRLLKVS